MWKRISDEMKNSGYNVTLIQIENKWKTLERQYKKVISNNNKTGRGRITCSYQMELTEILGKSHKIVPLAVASPEIRVMVRDSVLDPRTLLNNSAPILMPVSATTTLPTTSNVERREEPEDMPMAFPDKSEAVTVPENANLVAVAKRRMATGTTAKVLQQCQKR
ncbi:uncharacterized protein LOC113004769 [Solenopsis invicta]|uniref:uncharacterized protein LOC113004769 n=1 Tax=Solenopsis invicta TaxID=13686 RepID=UPI000E33FECD|nr:uncharacterized protein LOC113004769 [Solenopsis invicta]